MEKRANFSNICRTCLTELSDMKSIFSHNICEMLTTCANVKIHKSDGLPEQICTKCIEDVKVSYQFKIKSENSDQYLRKIVLEEETEKGEFASIIVKEENSSEVHTLLKKDAKTNETLPKIEPLHIVLDDNTKVINSNSGLTQADSFDDDSNDCDIKSLPPSPAESDERNDKPIKKKRSKASTRNKSNAWKCKICRKTFLHKPSLQEHMIAHPEYSTKSLFCSICSKVYFDKMSLKSHMLRHSEKKFSCETCDKSFYELVSLANHIKNHHEANPVTCPMCQKSFVLQLQLDLHMKRHPAKKHECKTCGKEAKSSKALRAHNLSHNTNPFPCTQCDKWFKYASSLKIHVRMCHLGMKKKDVCTICGTEVFNLKHHTIRKHPTDRPYKCDQCDQAFAKEWVLNDHYKMHTGETTQRKQLCTVCGKELHDVTSLRYHMRIHTGEKPYKCLQCDKTFKTNNEMRVHMRTHSGERPYECPLCQKRFTTKRCVKKHQLVHTGERPHKCNLCGRGFSQK